MKGKVRFPRVIRSGKFIKIMAWDVLVGDVVCISAGDVVPADGILIECDGLNCDESMCTGESDLVKKMSGDEAFTILHRMNGVGIPARTLNRLDPFLMSGTRVQEGSGKFLVTGVGVYSISGSVEMAVSSRLEEPGYQSEKITKWTRRASRLGIVLGLLLLVVYAVKFAVLLHHGTLGLEEKVVLVLGLLASCIALVTLFSPSDFGPLLTAWTFRMMVGDNMLVRNRRAWERASAITTICTGLTGLIYTEQVGSYFRCSWKVNPLWDCQRR